MISNSENLPEDFVNKKISVIVPCYNAENYIVKCIESIVNQSIGFRFIDLIIVDDASTDLSRKYLLEYKKLFPESIQLFFLNQNEGQANARNIGIENARAEYFTFVDADDWVEPDIYEKMLGPANQYQCDIVQCGEVQHYFGLSEVTVQLNNPEKLYKIDSDEDRKYFMNHYSMAGMIGVSLYKTSWIKKNDIRFKQYLKYEDNYWGMLVLFGFQTYYSLPHALYHYCIREHSNSHSRNDNLHFERLKIELDKLSYYQDREGLWNRYYKEIRKSFLESFYSATLHIICCQFDRFPLEVVEVMQTTVKEIYPDYMDYCRESDRFINPVITVAFHFDLNMWNQYKDAYYAWASKGEEEAIRQFYHKMRNVLSI